MKRINIQLYKAAGGFPRGPMITDTGGVVFVATAGGATKATLMDSTGASLANPVTLTNGGADIYVANTVASVDLYIMAPGGQFVVERGAVPGSDSEIAVDTTSNRQVAIIPFSVTDQTGDATETDTGFNEPTNGLIESAAVRISTVDAAITIDVGTDSTDSGDANGFLAAASTAAAVVVPGSLASGGQTLGALLSADESGAGVLVPLAHASGGKSITYTLLTAADTAEGFIVLPYLLT